jgi:VanZ family protein
VVGARVSPWIPVLLWAGLIFSLSSIPSLDTGLGTWDVVLRKLAHLAEYAILGMLAYRAVRREPLAIALASAYAATDELHQAFVSGRHGSPLDWLIDTGGVVAGVVLFARAAR